jgi:Protein of unknown function (DUF3015)
MKYILLAFALVSNIALAEKPYGMAGCGLGSVIIGKDGSQIFAVTTNGTGTQTFGITSGTSNCVTATQQTAKIKNFIETNYESLITDMAKGNGESIKTLSSMYGCSTKKFTEAMKSNYETITPDTTDATYVMVNINNVISDSPALNSSCHNVL